MNTTTPTCGRHSQASKLAPYISVGSAAKWFPPIHPVVKGMSDNQNGRWRLAHSTLPLTDRAACSR